MYTKPLPSMDKIKKLAKLTAPFPADTAKLVHYAKRNNFGKEVVDFMNHFPYDEIFESQGDFLARCEGIEFLISEEREAPYEFLRSPQG